MNHRTKGVSTPCRIHRKGRHSPGGPLPREARWRLATATGHRDALPGHAKPPLSPPELLRESVDQLASVNQLAAADHRAGAGQYPDIRSRIICIDQEVSRSNMAEYLP